MNENYIKSLKTLTEFTRPDAYIVMGSVALLSYTQKTGYERQIHDIDLIMERNEAQRIAQELLNIGYIQSTFIDKRMPFYKKLNKLSGEKYLRFSRDGIDIEILATEFVKNSDYLTFELYPHIKAELPVDAITTSAYRGVEFSTVSKEMLYFFKKVANNTVGRKVKYKEAQRNSDIEHLEKLVDFNKLNVLKLKSKLCVFGICFRLPGFFLR